MEAAQECAKVYKLIPVTKSGQDRLLLARVAGPHIISRDCQAPPAPADPSLPSLSGRRGDGFPMITLKRIALGSVPVLAALLLSACPKREWQYAPPPAPAPSKDFDAHFDPAKLDPNGAARNVDWQSQHSGRIPNPDACNEGQPYSATCTQDKPFLDQPDGVNEAFCFIGKLASGSPLQPFYGHADWMLSQFNGSVGWFNFGDDWDYGLMLIPASDLLPPAPPPAINEHGITTNNSHVTGDSGPQYVEVEFNSLETDPAFTQGWWNDFKMSGHNNDAASLAGLLHPNQKTLACGSIVGLFGLDCDHGCRSELHPVYGIAVQRTEDPNDNEWSVMARNWGTGGYCSQYNDELAAANISINLPYTSSQPPTNVEIQNFTAAANDSTAHAGCPSVYFDNGQTIVSLALPPPQQQPVASFTLKIQWPAGAQPVSCTQPNVDTTKLMSLAPERPPVNGPMRGEDYMGALLHSAAQSQNIERPELERNILPAVPESQTRMQSLKKMALTSSPQPCDGTIPVRSGLPQPMPVTAVHKLKIDANKQVRDQAVRNYVCRNYKAKAFALPANTTRQDFDQACKGVK